MMLNCREVVFHEAGHFVKKNSKEFGKCFHVPVIEEVISNSTDIEVLSRSW